MITRSKNQSRPKSMRVFCTYFDSGYMARGLAMCESLRRAAPSSEIWILTLDEQAEQCLSRLRLPGVRTVPLETLEGFDRDLSAARHNRSLVEYYWTCTSAFCRYLLDTNPEIDLLTYLDADLFFFSDPEPVFKEIGNSSIAITPHDFSEHLTYMNRSGRFNVGWVTFRRDANGLACLKKWREQCIEWCYHRFEEGKFGDQKYLDSWNDEFAGVVVLDHPGVNAAPWNVNGTRIIGLDTDRNPLANDKPLVFYHFHNLKGLGGRYYSACLDNYGTTLGPTLRQHVYEPYVSHLRKWENRLGIASDNQRLKAGADKSRCPSFLFPAWSCLKAFLHRQIVTAAVS
jgi:hypothetical protein